MPFGRLGLPRWLPLVLSSGLFAVDLHWDRGLSAMVGAFWFWWVLGTTYVSRRGSSRPGAFWITTAVHWMPLLFLLAVAAGAPIR